MDLGTIKIISQIIAQLSLTEYIYLPSGRKLGFLSAYDIMNNDEIMMYVNNPRLQNLIEKMEIHGIATKENSALFLNTPSGKTIIEKIVDNSSAKGQVDLDELIRVNYLDVEGKLNESTNDKESK